MNTDLKTTLPLAASQQVPDPKATHDRAALRKSCQDFEAIFIQSLFQSMRKTVPEDGLFEQDNATRIYQDMLDQEIATQISRKQSLGLADQMYRQMEKLLSSKK